MVCDRCRMAVRSELEQLQLHPQSIELGIVELREDHLTDVQLSDVNKQLTAIGFELLDDGKRKLVEQIRTAVIELIHYENDGNQVKHSEYLAHRVGRDYPAISKIFSDETHITIEQYIIYQKIEKVKELLSYGQLTLSEIAWQMGYSSVAAISAQFKKVTGMTPSQYKSAENKDRKTLDKIGK